MFKGLYTAVVTPFLEDESLDKEGFKKLLKHQIEAGVDGVVVLGSTGEAATLGATERSEILALASGILKGKTHFIVGTGHHSTRQTIAWTKEAEKNGADGALVVTPYYNKPTQEGLYEHFKAVAESTSLPICLYNVPSRTGVNLDPSTFQRLSLLPTILSIKEASGNMGQIQGILKVIENAAPHIAFLSGDDALAFPTIALGGKGLISVASNLFPKQLKTLIHLLLEGNLKEAKALHFELLPFFDGCFIETNPSPIKAALEIAGLGNGKCRLPLAPLLPKSRDSLKTLLATLPNSWFPHG